MMGIPIEDLLPNDVLDEIVVSDQTHVLGYFEENSFTEEDVCGFVNQCKSFDMIRACNLYTNSLSRNRILSRMYNDIKEYPTDYIHFGSLSEEKRNHYIDKGEKLIAEGKLALILLAGGQASRFSPEIIMGDYDMGLPSHKTLFHRICQSILYVENLVSKNVDKSTIIHLVSFKEIHIPVFIMTSEFNNQAIIDDILSLIQLFTFIILFCKHDYYGLEKDQVVFFSQGSLPCVDERGHFIMRKQHQIALSPNGSGGLFFALQKHHIATQLKERGVQYVQCFGIDNVMEIPGDPLFLGYASEQSSEMCIKCVEKCCPDEQLSMIVEYSGKPLLAVCSEMKYHQICKRDSNANLVYRYGFIFDSIISLDFLLNECTETSLPAYCHIVKKAIPYFDPILNRTIKPISPNAYKMEYYFSDVFPLAHSISVVVIPREEFIPIKNPPGKPIATPEKAVEALSTLQLSFLKKNQIKIQNCSNQLVHFEVSPLVSIRDEGYGKLKDVEICLPCCVYDHSEVDLKEEEYQKITNSIALLTHKRNDCFIYVVL